MEEIKPTITDISEYIKESSEIRYDINENLHSKARTCKKIFAGLFNRKSNVFTRIKDLEYYKGGYPKEDSPSKIDSLVDTISELLIMLDYLGKDELITRFEEKGITIKIQDSVKEIESQITADSNIELDSYLVANEFEKEKLKREDRQRIINELLGMNLKVQKQICEKADIIKLEHAPSAESLVGINSRDYRDCVNFAYKKLKNSKIEKPLDDYKAGVDSKLFASSLIDDIVA